MISSWKQFWSSEGKIVLLLCFLGVSLGSIVSFFSKDWGESFDSIELIGYKIPETISFEITVSLAIQLTSVFLSRLALYRGADFYHKQIVWLLTGVPLGILIVLNIFDVYLVAIGFVIPYIAEIILTPIMMIFVGWDTMHLLWANALSLIPLYIISTGTIWVVESCRSSFSVAIFVSSRTALK
jgi:uncharacterized membrane protein